jgi:hypothetical protein
MTVVVLGVCLSVDPTTTVILSVRELVIVWFPPPVIDEFVGGCTVAPNISVTPVVLFSVDIGNCIDIGATKFVYACKELP